MSTERKSFVSTERLGPLAVVRLSKKKTKEDFKRAIINKGFVSTERSWLLVLVF